MSVDGPLTLEHVLLSTQEFDPQSVYQLVLKNASIRGPPEGLAPCVNLAFVDLAENGISTLRPLSSCRELLHLDVRFNKLTSLEGLGGCLKLHRVGGFARWMRKTDGNDDGLGKEVSGRRSHRVQSGRMFLAKEWGMAPI